MKINTEKESFLLSVRPSDCCPNFDRSWLANFFDEQVHIKYSPNINPTKVVASSFLFCFSRLLYIQLMQTAQQKVASLDPDILSIASLPVGRVS